MLKKLLSSIKFPRTEKENDHVKQRMILKPILKLSDNVKQRMIFPDQRPTEQGERNSLHETSPEQVRDLL